MAIKKEFFSTGNEDLVKTEEELSADENFLNWLPTGAYESPLNVKSTDFNKQKIFNSH
jgi:hypothetical protein